MANQRLVAGLVVLISVFYAVHSASVMFDTSVVSEHCLKDKPVHSDYTPLGNEYEIGNLTVYETNNRSARRLLIAVYDIFGLSNNMKEVCDTIASMYNFRVVMPDFFRGIYWDENNFPPSDPEEMSRWLQNNGSWDNIVQWDIKNVIDSFATRDLITEVGIFGMCWGGKVATLASTFVDEIKVAALVHPSSVNNSEVDGVKNPMYLCPSQNEPDMIPFYEVLQQKFGNNTGHRRFDDMFHGFAGARGNFSNPLNRQRVDEVIDILGGFFSRNLRNE